VVQPKLELPPPRRQTGPTGLDGRTADRLRRGLLQPDAKLDLHGLTEAAAHRALITFIKGAHARGVRLALVVTGKGGREEPADAPFDLEFDRRTRGVLKMMTPRWLQERDLVDLVADVRSAHRKHGGGGALYVYLRKRMS
jgi:DNA-nicking Smr family endonuclease